jgi:ParB family chromosome partitioning protein
MNAKAQTKPAPLGRGLSALFGDADVSYQPKNASAAPSSSGASGSAQTAPQKLPIEWIQPGAFQPRRHFDDTAIQELADSIKERGILQPLMVRPLEGEKDLYEIIAGERRWRAAQIVGLHEVPVLIRSFTDREAMEIGLIENVQRQDLSLIEEAEGYRRLIEEFHHTQENLAKIVGKSRPHIANLLRLLKLPSSVRQMLSDGSLSMGHARAIVTADNPETVAKEIVKKGLNVRQAEALAKKLSDGRFAKKERTRKDVDPNILSLENNLQNALGLKVRLQSNGATGTLVLHYGDLDQLDLILKKLQAE